MDEQLEEIGRTLGAIRRDVICGRTRKASGDGMAEPQAEGGSMSDAAYTDFAAIKDLRDCRKERDELRAALEKMEQAFYESDAGAETLKAERDAALAVLASTWSCGHARFPVALESHPECAVCYKTERDAALARAEAAEGQLLDSPVQCDCHPGVRWTVETWGERCPLSAALARAERAEAAVLALWGMEGPLAYAAKEDIRTLVAEIRARKEQP